jgi:hypothetical protein
MQLVKYEQARTALALCCRIDEAKDIGDKAEALRAYGRQANDKDLEVWAAEIKLRAQIRIGEISRELEKAKPGGAVNGKKGGSKIDLPSGGMSKNETLKAAGLTTQVASRCERLASVPEQKVEAILEEKKEKGKPVTTNDVLRLAPASEKKRPSGPKKQEFDESSAVNNLRVLFGKTAKEWPASRRKQLVHFWKQVAQEWVELVKGWLEGNDTLTLESQPMLLASADGVVAQERMAAAAASGGTPAVPPMMDTAPGPESGDLCGVGAVDTVAATP